jgi:hypothetical protein
MKEAGTCLETENPLLLSVIGELERGCELIKRLDDLTYIRSATGTGHVGGHFRHNLDIVNNFLIGIAERRIDYNRRERDIRIETDREYAVEKLDLAKRRIGNLNDGILERLVSVRSEVNPTTWLPSSVTRELEFVHSHTVHHHALIAEKLAGFGIAVNENFGVAPSTLKYWQTRAA